MMLVLQFPINLELDVFKFSSTVQIFDLVLPQAETLQVVPETQSDRALTHPVIFLVRSLKQYLVDLLASEFFQVFFAHFIHRNPLHHSVPQLKRFARHDV